MHTPCAICNEIHLGASLHHAHEDKEGVGYVRLLVIGNGVPEYCWRCGCRKSGYTNVANPQAIDCDHCICHTAEYVH